MNKRTKLIAAALVLCAAGGAIMWMSTQSAVKGAAAVMPKDDKYVDPFDKVNQKAKAAKKNDEKAVKELTEEIVDMLAPAAVPSFIKDKMKTRLARAEKNHRASKKDGISESNVVKMINELADKFGAPEYVKTDLLQVRVARIGLSAYMPDFVATEASEPKQGERKTLGLMSPLEAMTVAMHLLQQKMSNEAWQLTPQEFATNLHRKQLERWQTRHNQKNGGEQIVNSETQPKTRLRSGKSNPKREAVRQAINRSATSMKPEDLTGLADVALDTLGIKR